MTLSELQVLVLKSLNKHCESVILDLPITYLGDKKVENLESWCELRVFGPDLTPRGGDSVKVEVSLNVLVCTVRKRLAIYDHFTNVGKATKAFETNVVIAEGLCLTQIGSIDTRHVGNATEKVNMSQTTINCNYILEA